MPNNRCTNCITYNLECTYVEAAKVRCSPERKPTVLTHFVMVETRTSERVRSMRRLVACLPTQYHRYSYVEGLEARLVKMEKLLLKVNPDTCAYIHQF